MATTARFEAQMKKDMAAKVREAKDPIEKLRFQCLARGASGIKGLGRLFKIMDDNGNRSLDREEFMEGLNDYGIFLDSDEEYQEIFNRFDSNMDGTISFDEFLKALRPPLKQNRIALIRKAFNKLDHDGNGILTSDDLKGKFDVKQHPDYVSGKKDEDELFKEFLKSFEPEDIRKPKDGVVTWDEFLSYYSGVSQSIENDAYFNLMMTQAWKL